MKNFVLKLTAGAVLAALTVPAIAGGFVGGIFKENAAYKHAKGPVYSTYAVSSSCNAESPALAVNVNANTVLRNYTPPGVFGFTMDWYQFQYAFYPGYQVSTDVSNWLKPFSGALYRFSGDNYYHWSKAVGPLAQRQAFPGFFGANEFPAFGPAEFFNFLKLVNGKGIILLNVADAPMDDSAMIADNLAYIKWISQNVPNAFGPNSPMAYFELGNELDTETPFVWSAATYIARVSGLIKAAKQLYPNIKFAVLGKTAPWGPGGETDSAGQNFDATVAAALAPIADAVTIHPYYDGYPINMIQGYIDKLAKLYQGINPAVKVLVTEHGKWPSMPAVGPWSNNWYQASGSIGALSTADFTLMAMTDPNIAGATWQTMAVMGPWQLFHMNSTTHALYPSAVYSAVRTLREGFLTQLIQVNPSIVAGTSYGGGYDIRMVAMKNATGNTSLMGVNRSGIARVLSLKTQGIPPGTVKMEVAIMQGDQAGSDNVDNAPNKYMMKTSTYNYSPVTSAPGVCIPPYSTFSIILGDRYK